MMTQKVLEKRLQLVNLLFDKELSIRGFVWIASVIESLSIEGCQYTIAVNISGVLIRF